MSSADRDVYNRIEKYLEAYLTRAADETFPIDGGLVAGTRTLPQVWSLNQISLNTAPSFDEMVDLAERHQGDLPYRHLTFSDRDAVSALEAEVAAAGWTVEHDLYLAIPGGAEVESTGEAPDVLDMDEMFGLMRQWMLDDHPDATEETLLQMDEYHRRSAEGSGEVCFGVRDQGRPVALTKLRSDGVVAWVEDVYTLAGHRGRGHARRLVSHAAATAVQQGHELIFIIADDDDWPKELYESVGFRPVGRGSIFHLPMDR